MDRLEAFFCKKVLGNSLGAPVCSLFSPGRLVPEKMSFPPTSAARNAHDGVSFHHRRCAMAKGP